MYVYLFRLLQIDEEKTGNITEKQAKILNQDCRRVNPNWQ